MVSPAVSHVPAMSHLIALLWWSDYVVTLTLNNRRPTRTSESVLFTIVGQFVPVPRRKLQRHRHADGKAAGKAGLDRCGLSKASA
eukprot:scaffold40825_cov13-Prasinocladus_malaysianus.AAC.2